MLGSPIKNHIGMVFVPVSNMEAAVDWYSRLFGLPVDATSHRGLIYAVRTSGEVGLILDAHRPVANSSQPLCFFWTDDIHAARTYLVETGAAVVRDVEDIGSVSTLTFEDLDHNLLMVCQRNEVT